MERKKYKYTEEVRNNGVSVVEEEVFFDGYDDDYHHTLSIWMRMAQMSGMGMYRFSENLYEDGREIVLSYWGVDGVSITRSLFMYFDYD